MTRNHKWLKFWMPLVSFLALVLSASTLNAETITYYHNDTLGSPVAATDSTGQLVWRENYRPYGAKLWRQPSDNQVWFTGKTYYEDIGLSYFGARWYSPGTGRFISPDPVDGITDLPEHRFSRYAYANNNPYRYVDPNGKWAISANRIWSIQNNRWERSYNIHFQKGGTIGAYLEASVKRASKFITRAGGLHSAADKYVDSMPRSVGHGDLGFFDELDARSADNDIQEKMKEKWPYKTTYIPQKYIDQALRNLWESTPDDLKEKYGYKSHIGLLREVNKHDFPHPSDPGRKEKVYE